MNRLGRADGQARAICQRISGLLVPSRCLQGLVGDFKGGKLFDRSVVHDSHPFVRQRRSANRRRICDNAPPRELIKSSAVAGVKSRQEAWRGARRRRRWLIWQDKSAHLHDQFRPLTATLLARRGPGCLNNWQSRRLEILPRFCATDGRHAASPAGVGGVAPVEISGYLE
jgi:hypothetical protein